MTTSSVSMCGVYGDDFVVVGDESCDGVSERWYAYGCANVIVSEMNPIRFWIACMLACHAAVPSVGDCCAAGTGEALSSEVVEEA